MILRLVDIVLLVLFGFISVATIEDQKRIELADAHEVIEQQAQDRRMVTLTIDAWGDFFIEGNLNEASLEEVAHYLEMERNLAGTEEIVHVRIRADRAAKMENIKWIANLCDELDIEKSLVVKRITSE